MKKTVFHVFLVLVFSSCAYYNTLYNAKKAYEDAQSTVNESQRNTALENAAKKASKVVTEYPNSKYVPEAMLLLGKTYYEMKEYDKSLKTLEQLALHYPKSEYNTEAQLLTAKLYVDQENFIRARTILEEYLNKENIDDETKEEAYFIMIDLLINEKLYSKAVNFINSHLDNIKNKKIAGKLYLKLAIVYKESNDFTKAVSIYTDLLETDLDREDYFLTRMGLIEINLILQKKDFLDALFKEIDMGKLSLEQRGRIKIKEAEYLALIDERVEAFSLLDEVIAGTKNTEVKAEAIYTKGKIHFTITGELDEAEKPFKIITSDDAMNATKYGEFAKDNLISIQKLKTLKEQEQQYQDNSSSVRLDKDLIMAEYYLFTTNNFLRAIEIYENLIPQLNNQPKKQAKAKFALGWIYKYRAENEEKADNLFKEIVETLPNTKYAASAANELGIEFKQKLPIEYELEDLLREDNFVQISDETSKTEKEEQKEVEKELDEPEEKIDPKEIKRSNIDQLFYNPDSPKHKE